MAERTPPPPRIVQGGDRRALWLLLILILLVGGWSVYVFDYGRHWAGFDLGRALRLRAHLEEQIERVEAELQASRLEAAKFQRSAQIESEAARRIQAEFNGLHNENAGLKREVALLRSLVAQGKGPLFIRDFALTQGAKPSQINYNFSVVQVRKNIGNTKGTVLISVEGRVKKEKKRLDLAALTGGKQKQLALDFKHYQEISGQLVLPKGFDARSFVVELKPKSRKLKKVKQVYDWSLK